MSLPSYHSSLIVEGQMSAKRVKAASKKAAPKKAAPKKIAPKKTARRKTRTPSGSLRDELPLLRRAAFCKDPSYGEVRFLGARETPDLLRDPGALPVQIADWIAEEADGAVIGRLKLVGVPPELCPIVVIDNEGSLHLSGFSLVDHFGSFTDAAYHGRLEQLLSFCRKHDLPAPRGEAEIRKLARGLKLTVAGLEAGKVPHVDAAALQALRDSAAPPRPVAPGPKPAPVRQGQPSIPMAEYVDVARGPDGAPWVVTPPLKSTRTCKTVVHRFDGARFAVVGHLPGWVATVTAFQGQLVYLQDDRLCFFDGQNVQSGIAFAPDGRLLASETQLVAYVAGNPYAGTCSTVWRLCDKKMVKVVEEQGIFDATPVFVGEELLCLFGGKNAKYDDVRKARVVDLKAGTVKPFTSGGVQEPWGKPGSARRFVLCGGRLIAGGHEEVFAVDLKRGAWSKPKQTKEALDLLAPLGDGTVLAICSKSRGVHAIDPDTLSVERLGATQLRRNGYTTRVVQAADGKLIFFGGTLGLIGGKNPLAEPESFDPKSGNATALPGRARELAAQVKAQR